MVRATSRPSRRPPPGRGDRRSGRAHPVPVSVRQSAAAQAAGRPAAAPVVHVTTPQPVVQEVRVMVDRRQIAAAVQDQRDSDRLRGGRG